MTETLHRFAGRRMTCKQIKELKFNRLVPVMFTGEKYRGEEIWIFQCDCGERKEARLGVVARGMIKSCGNCIRERHGKSKTPEYVVWQKMHARCCNPKEFGYYRYGGRGIKVCERWNQFSCFLADMGSKPSTSHKIERKDNDGDYEPDNCRWATVKEQSVNKCSNHKVWAFGKVQCISEWAEEYGLNYDTLYNRIAILNWHPEDAISTKTYPTGIWHKRSKRTPRC